MNRILKRQLEIFVTPEEKANLPENFQRLCERISATYDSFDEDRKLIERSLEVSSEEMTEKNTLLSSIVNSMIEGVLVVDENSYITFYNNRFTQIWNINQETLNSKKDSDALAEGIKLLEDPDGFLSRVQELYSDRVASGHDIIHFKDGRIFERFTVPVMDGDVYYGRLWSFRDITETQKYQEGIISQKNELEKAMRLMVGRELSMVDLKQEIAKLRKQLDTCRDMH